MRQDAAARVLFVATGGTGDGAERFAATVVRHLDRARFRPSLALLGDGAHYPTPTDVATQALPAATGRGLSAAAGMLGAVAGMLRVLRRERPHVVASLGADASLACGVASWLARPAPAWVARIAADPDHAETGWRRPILRRLYRRADRLVANSRALCARAEEVHGVTARLLPNATDFAALDRAAREPVPAPAPGRRRLVAVGRLEPVKRFDLALEAAARLRDRFDVELVICGEGSERGRLEARSRSLGLSARLHLPGFVANPFAWVASADLFVLSSDSEGLPNALVEAQGLGVAAVACDCGTGPGEVVEHGVTGLLAPPGDPGALADAVAALLGNDARRRAMGDAARERARARYGVAGAVAELEALLEEVAAPRRPAPGGRSQIS